MIVYHLSDIDSVESVLRNGLKSSDAGSRSKEPLIIKTDQLLESLRPPHIIESHISRLNNTYAFLANGPDTVVNITDGETIKLSHLHNTSQQALLKVDVDPNRCFVSNLDTYDTIKSAVEDLGPSDTLTQLAHKYWMELQLLETYRPGSISRPEVMITYDVPPQAILRLT